MAEPSDELDGLSFQDVLGRSTMKPAQRTWTAGSGMSRKLVLISFLTTVPALLMINWRGGDGDSRQLLGMFMLIAFPWTAFGVYFRRSRLGVGIGYWVMITTLLVGNYAALIFFSQQGPWNSAFEELPQIANLLFWSGLIIYPVQSAIVAGTLRRGLEGNLSALDFLLMVVCLPILTGAAFFCAFLLIALDTMLMQQLAVNFALAIALGLYPWILASLRLTAFRFKQ